MEANQQIASKFKMTISELSKKSFKKRLAVLTSSVQAVQRPEALTVQALPPLV